MTAPVSALTDGWVVTKRNLIKIKRIPDLLIFSTIQPIMLVVLFAYVFGGSIAIPGVNYREYLMAGIFTRPSRSARASPPSGSPTTCSGASSTGSGRFRCPGLPFWSGAPPPICSTTYSSC